MRVLITGQSGYIGSVLAPLSWIGPRQPVFRWSDLLPAVCGFAALIGGRLRKFGKLRRHT
jgi:hypothetical protein